MTASSASKSSASEPILLPGTALHLWLCRRENCVDSDQLRREILSRYAPLDPADWRFGANRHGKPQLIDPPSPLSFNLSHSGEWLACAVSAGAAVGVDLEYCDAGRDVLKLARRYFLDVEAAELAGLPEAQRKDRFYDYWTLKEAWIKARGLTIARELQHAGIELDGAGSIELRAPVEAFPADFWLLDLSGDYRLALCAQRPASGCVSVRIFDALPGGGKKPVELALRAASAGAGRVT